MNPYQKPLEHMRMERERRAELERDLGAYVGRSFIFHGPADHDRAARRLYPERVGRRCLVAGVSQDRGRCPLLIVFQDGYRGIAEAEWLVDGEVSA